MSTPVIELFRRASDLPESDRALLAGLLIQTVPWEEVKARLMKHSDGK